MADLAWSFRPPPAGNSSTAAIWNDVRRRRRSFVGLIGLDAVTTMLLWFIGWHFNLKVLWQHDVRSFSLVGSSLDIALVSLLKCIFLTGCRTWKLSCGVAVCCLAFFVIKGIFHAAEWSTLVVHHMVWVQLSVLSSLTMLEICFLWRFARDSAQVLPDQSNGQDLTLAMLQEGRAGSQQQVASSNQDFFATIRKYYDEHNKLIEFAREKEKEAEAHREKIRREAEARGRDIPPLDANRLWKEFRENASLTVIVPATILSFSLCLMSVVSPTVNGKLMDAVVLKISNHDHSISDMAPYFWVIGSIAVYNYFANVAVGILFALARWRMSMAMRKKLCWALICQDVTFFDSNPSGTLTSRLVHDADQMQGVLNTTGDTIGKTLVQFSSGSIAIFLTDWRLALLGIISSPVIVRLTRLTGRIVGYYSLVQNDAMAVANSLSTEAIGNIRTVQANAAEPEELRAYAKAIDTYVDVIMHTLFSETFLRFVRSFMDQSTDMAILIYGFYLVVHGEISLGQYSAFRAYLATYHAGFNSIMNLWVQFKSIKTSSQRYFELVDRVPLVTSPSYPNSLPPIPLLPERGQTASSRLYSKGVVCFNDVSFAYPKIVEVGFSSLRYGTLPWAEGARRDASGGGICTDDECQVQCVLRGVSFEVHPGQMVALVGRSGAGKSTTVKILQRFYDPYEGKVTLDGKDLREMDLQDLRSHFGYVEQEPTLFNRSVRDNIAYGLELGECDREDDECLKKAAMDANAHDFIMELPQQYDTICGERGVRLSGGQKQRMAIARAIIRKPRVFILDEATASLDAESEKLVQTALKRVRVDRSLVVIAHRLSTIRDSDSILVFDQGSIVERGTHKELLNKGGRYAALVEQQLM